MSQKLHWTFDEESGTVTLPDRSISLLAHAGLLDRVQQLQKGQDGLLLESVNEDGRITLHASGGLRFFAQGKEYRKVVVPSGAEIMFAVAEAKGRLRFTGSVVRDSLLGTSLGGYKLKNRLGAGAVGVVYQATQTSLQRDVALKVLSAKAAADPKAIDSFVHEAQSAGRLTHPNLVQVHDVGESAGKHYYSMELVPGGNLEEKLETDGPLPWQEAVSAARDCALALAFAEEHGLVHRDVKPENLMVSEAGLVKLADLGLAATREMLDGEGAGGTPHFMAPEAALGQNMDGRADLYSLGCSLYRLLTGETLFTGSSVREILRAHQEEDPPSLEEFEIVLPKGLNDLVQALLEKDPADRPAHASEVAEELESILQSRSKKKTLLFMSVVLLLLTFLVVQESLREDSVDPKTVFVEVESPDAEETRLQLEAAQIEVAYNQALAQVASEDRLAALLSFQERYPESPFSEDIPLQITKVQAKIQNSAEIAAQAVTEAEQLNEKARAVEAELARIKALADRNDWANALALVVQSSFVAHPSVSAMASWLQENAESYARLLEQDHRKALELSDWNQAKEIRAQWVQSFGERRADWAGRLFILQDLASLAELRQEAVLRQAVRTAFLETTSGPALQEMLRFQEEAAFLLWDTSTEETFHGRAWNSVLQVFRETAKSSAALKATAESGEVQNYRAPESGKRSAILAWKEAGLVIELTERGERIQKTLPWSTFSDPAILSQLLEALNPRSFEDQRIGIFFLVHASAFVAVYAEQELKRNPAAVAASITSWLAEYRTRWSTASVDSPLILELEMLAQLSESLAAGDAYLALQRLEDFGEHFNLLPLWLSDGNAEWRLHP